MYSRRSFVRGAAGLLVPVALACSSTAVHASLITQAGARYTAPIAGAPFDYYLSPTGDDNNAGTLASPWSITALTSKGSTYTGKRVGMLAGTYQYGTVGGVQTTIYSLLNAQGSGNVAIRVNGGTSGNPTYLGSSDVSGNYLARTATIDASNPSGGARSTNTDGQVLGQVWYGGNPPSTAGYVTIDGLIIKTFTGAALAFGDFQATVLNGLTIKNCELYDASTVSNNNPGAIILGNTSGAQVLNCKVHDLQTTSSGSYYTYGMNGIMTYTTHGLIVTNCTFYNCAAIQQKDGYQDSTVSYCYLDIGSFGSVGSHDYQWAFCGIPGSGKTTTVHHCILLGMMRGYGLDGTTYVGTINFYNNTSYSGTNANPVLNMTPGSGGVLNSYNNIFYPNAAWCTDPSGVYIIGGNGTNTPQSDYNYYKTAPTFQTTYAAGLSLATWQGRGFDAHSIAGSSPFSGTPTAVSPSSFAITGAALTAGIGGVPCGALDGSGSIGANW